MDAVCHKPVKQTQTCESSRKSCLVQPIRRRPRHWWGFKEISLIFAGAHLDGPLYQDYVQILSLHGTATIEFFLKEHPQDSLKIFLQPRSLLIFTREAYTKYYHVIHSRREDIIDDTYINLPIASKKHGNHLLMNRGGRGHVFSKERQTIVINSTNCNKDLNARAQKSYFCSRKWTSKAKSSVFCLCKWV